MTLPIAFTFPNLGVVLLLLFVPFAGCVTGNPVTITEYQSSTFSVSSAFLAVSKSDCHSYCNELEYPPTCSSACRHTGVYRAIRDTACGDVTSAGVALLSAGWQRTMAFIQPRSIGMFAGGSVAMILLAIGDDRNDARSTVDQAYSKETRFLRI